MFLRSMLRLEIASLAVPHTAQAEVACGDTGTNTVLEYVRQIGNGP